MHAATAAGAPRFIVVPHQTGPGKCSPMHVHAIKIAVADEPVSWAKPSVPA